MAETKNSTAANAKGLTLAQKLFEIQKKIKNFTNTEGSEKKIKDTEKSAYEYTPGYVIIEAVREQMDALGLMLFQENIVTENKLIEYTNYLNDKNGNTTPIKKQEILTTVQGLFTWMDVETGEKMGPFRIDATGANGTDKSCASAIALAERYYLLKTFHIATKDKTYEPDAHDSGSIPGLRSGEQVNFSRQPAPMQQMPQAPAPQYPYGQPMMPQGFQPQYQQPYGQQPYGQPYFPQQAPAYQQMQPAAPAQGAKAGQRNPYATPPTYAQPQPQQPQTQKPLLSGDYLLGSVEFQSAAKRLSNFPRGTNSHTETVRALIEELAPICDVKAPNFTTNLIEAAEAIREGRVPNFA